MSDQRRLGVGERARDFALPGPSGELRRFYAYAGGRPTALVFAGDVADPRLGVLAGQVIGRDDVAAWCVTRRSPPAGGGLAAWPDAEGKVAAAYGVAPDEVTAFVLDPNLRVVAVVVGDRLAERTVDLLDAARYRGPPAEVRGQAPVLFVPGALESAYRDRLIGTWLREGSTETGVERSGGAELDDSMKRRRDHVIGDPGMLGELTAVVGRRVLPEVAKAFAVRATRFEGFKIACYAAPDGYFRPHRDNLTPATAHRMFALTVNLNEDYHGGQLRFPEYGNQLYRPGAGAALVFSCAHLHEVLDVTTGRRFVLLSFLYVGTNRPGGPGAPTSAAAESR